MGINISLFPPDTMKFIQFCALFIDSELVANLDAILKCKGRIWMNFGLRKFVQYCINV
jgi:hypothetical protein